MKKTVSFGGTARVEDLIGSAFGQNGWYNNIRFRPQVNMTVALPFWSDRSPFVRLNCEAMLYLYRNSASKPAHALRPGIRAGLKDFGKINLELEYMLQMNFAPSGTNYNNIFRLVIVKST